MDMIDKLKKEAYKQYPEMEGYFESDAYKIGLFIHKNRIQQKLSQQDLADKANIDKRTFVIAETGGGGTSDKVYEKIFKALDLEHLFWDTDKSKSEITATITM